MVHWENKKKFFGQYCLRRVYYEGAARHVRGDSCIRLASLVTYGSALGKVLVSIVCVWFYYEGAAKHVRGDSCMGLANLVTYDGALGKVLVRIVCVWFYYEGAARHVRGTLV
jgi:hypothetical protein